MPVWPNSKRLRPTATSPRTHDARLARATEAPPKPKCLRDEDDAPDCLPALDIRVCGSRVGERERPVDEHCEPTRGNVIDERTDHCAGAIGEDLRAEEDAGQRVVPHRQQRHVERLRVTARGTDRDRAPAVRETLHALAE